MIYLVLLQHMKIALIDRLYFSSAWQHQRQSPDPPLDREACEQREASMSLEQMSHAPNQRVWLQASDEPEQSICLLLADYLNCPLEKLFAKLLLSEGPKRASRCAPGKALLYGKVTSATR